MAYPASILILHFGSYYAFKFMTNLIVSWTFISEIYKFDMNKVRIIEIN